MECRDFERVRPLDELLDDTVKEFDSGEDRECDRDLDRMIWELGDFGDEEPPQDGEEFLERPPLEEELVEKKRIVGRGGRASVTEDETEEVSLAGGDRVVGESIASESRRRKGRIVPGRGSGRKKKK